MLILLELKRNKRAIKKTLTFYGNSIERAIKKYLSFANFFTLLFFSLHLAELAVFSIAATLCRISLLSGGSRSSDRSANVFSPKNRLRNSLWIWNFRVHSSVSTCTIKASKKEMRNLSCGFWRVFFRVMKKRAWSRVRLTRCGSGKEDQCNKKSRKNWFIAWCYNTPNKKHSDERWILFSGELNSACATPLDRQHQAFACTMFISPVEWTLFFLLRVAVLPLGW